MIELRNVKLPLSGGVLKEGPYDRERLVQAAARRLRVDAGRIAGCCVARRSVDARNKSDVHFVATLHVNIADPREERELVASVGDAVARMVDEKPYEPAKLLDGADPSGVVVVGAGTAGLFCALALAEAGMRPVVFERGRPARERSRDVERFNSTGELDPCSNVQFGAGGAGTFSDGKLTTGTTSPANAWVVRRFVEMGASPQISWQAKPHIGSDVLPGVVESIAARIELLGGHIEWESRVVDLVERDGRIAGVEVETLGPSGSPSTRRVDCTACVLACGHSARDVFEMLKSRSVRLEPKAFSVGVRIEHPQSLIDRAQYGKAAGHPALPAADYKLSWHAPDGRGVYTFCMCPGGTVVAAASERGGVVTNGMSEFARDGANANAALLVGVAPQDLPGIGQDVLAGVAFQRAIERGAFEAGGGGYVAPAQLVGDFLAGTASSGQGNVVPTYPRGVRWCDLRAVLPEFVTEPMVSAIGNMARRLRGFDLRDAIMTGCETRSSSPVRVVRGEDLCSVSLAGLYPCGEGAGYAGGIMSAAVDGLRCAEAIVSTRNESNGI